jgi:hypothetical protein
LGRKAVANRYVAPLQPACAAFPDGRVAEWFKAPVLKTGGG